MMIEFASAKAVTSKNVIQIIICTAYCVCSSSIVLDLWELIPVYFIMMRLPSTTTYRIEQ